MRVCGRDRQGYLLWGFKFVFWERGLTVFKNFDFDFYLKLIFLNYFDILKLKIILKI
jgi:hypothetical protein